ncbi:hypothetical protein HOY80DRAFT_1041915 [Tuber brumale]|nr:hypothetical protein HOY80DRAFT_1041915 [Tuber brumale]
MKELRLYVKLMLGVKGVNSSDEFKDGSISVGNEAVLSAQARKDLMDKKHQGILVIVDNWVVVRDYPEFCKGSDYLAVNVHPGFDPDQLAKDAGRFLMDKVLKRLARAVFDTGC